MLEWLQKGSLPIGMFMLAVMAFGALYRRARSKHAETDFPTVAGALGLEHRKSPHQTGSGRLIGEVDGQPVIVDPDERSIIVRFRSEPLVELRSYARPRAPPPGMAPYRSGSTLIDDFFQTRFMSEPLARAIDAERLEPLVTLLRARYRRQLKHLLVTANGMTCTVDFGNPPHIPGDVVLELVPAMVQVAKVFDPASPIPLATESPAQLDA